MSIQFCQKCHIEACSSSVLFILFIRAKDCPDIRSVRRQWKHECLPLFCRFKRLFPLWVARLFWELRVPTAKCDAAFQPPHQFYDRESCIPSQAEAITSRTVYWTVFFLIYFPYQYADLQRSCANKIRPFQFSKWLQLLKKTNNTRISASYLYSISMLGVNSLLWFLLLIFVRWIMLK